MRLLCIFLTLTFALNINANEIIFETDRIFFKVSPHFDEDESGAVFLEYYYADTEDGNTNIELHTRPIQGHCNRDGKTVQCDFQFVGARFLTNKELEYGEVSARFTFDIRELSTGAENMMNARDIEIVLFGHTYSHEDALSYRSAGRCEDVLFERLDAFLVRLEASKPGLSALAYNLLKDRHDQISEKVFGVPATGPFGCSVLHEDVSALDESLPQMD